MPNIIDEFPHECLAIRIGRKVKLVDVIEVLSDLSILRGVPEHIRSDNVQSLSPRSCTNGLRRSVRRQPTSRQAARGRTAFIESFNARLRDGLLDSEILYSLNEARIVIESWRRHYNAVRPHASLGYEPPAPEVVVPAPACAGSFATPTSSAAALAPRPSIFNTLY
jgi:putative transposase